jgi:C4-dicarboxylate-specific signal transduction histidine kinase
LVGTALDVTERRRAEDRLAQKRLEIEELNRTLEARIDHTVNELRQKERLLVLQNRLAAMGEMIDSIAHQWRQPLNTLGLIIQQEQQAYEMGTFSKESIDENTGMAMEIIRHMSRTIDDFRNFFRPDKNKVSFRINNAIRHTLSLVEKSFQEQHISIELQPEGDPVAHGFPNEYAQVLMNILVNARDVMVERKIDNPRISIRFFVEGTKTVVTVTDNAGGVPEEILGKLFDSSFTTKGPDKGTGIGLYMSKLIIEQSMGGKLTAGNVGEGAEFRIEV